MVWGFRRPAARVVLLDKERQIFLVKGSDPMRPEKGTWWEIPGGGIEPGEQSMERLRYGKVCILADADSDGLHIAALLCAFFVKHYAPLVRDGRVHVAMPPLYRIDSAKDIFYARDEEEKELVLEKLGDKKAQRANVQRFKGLGEMNPNQLKETTLEPLTRTLLQLNLDSDRKTEAILDLLLGKKRAADRRDWLKKKGNLVSSI